MPVNTETLLPLAKKYLEDVWVHGNIKNLDHHFHPNAIIHTPLGEFKDLKSIASYIEVFTKGFSNLKIEILDAVYQGNKLAFRWQFHGVHTGNFLGAAPTNNKISYTGIAIYYFENDKISKYWIHGDIYGLLAQLGKVPKLGKVEKGGTQI